MLSISLSTIVNAIVRQEFRNRKKEHLENEALYFNFDLRMSYYDKGKSYSASRGLHLLYHSRGGSHISVFSGTTDSWFGSLKDVSKWNHEVTHDSEWANPSIFSQCYFEMAEELKIKMNKGVAPREMHEWHRTNRDNLFCWVPVSVTTDEIESYRRHICAALKRKLV